MRKLGLIAITLMLALGAVGVGYAAWAQPLYIDGTVNMGYIAAEYYDFVAPPDYYAKVTPVIGESGATIPNDPTHPINDKLTINIEDAYPSYSGIVQFRLENTGTVPFILENLADLDITVRDPWGVVVTNVIEITDSGTPWSIPTVEPAPYSNISPTYNLQISIPGTDAGGGWADPVQNLNYTITVDLNAKQFVQ
jgi:hypothetical protein